MEWGIFLLIILASVIFNKRDNSSSQEEQSPQGEGMTWEEMEKHYGITLSYEEEEAPSPSATYTSYGVEENDSNSYGKEQSMVTLGEKNYAIKNDISTESKRKSPSINEVGMKEKRNTRSSSSLQRSAKHGIVWSILLGQPKARQMKGYPTYRN